MDIAYPSSDTDRRTEGATRMEAKERWTVISLEGVFDIPAARFVEHSVKRLSAGDKVRIDFTRVRDFRDYGIAVLAQVLSKQDGIVVKMEGLRTHHVRLLRYFGIDSDAFRPDRAG
jgi:anti-anti-sigma regulatory factor